MPSEVVGVVAGDAAISESIFAKKEFEFEALLDPWEVSVVILEVYKARKSIMITV